MPLDPSDCYVPTAKIAHRLVGDAIAIVEPHTNLLVTLNPLGSEIWQRLDGRPMGRIVEEILETTEVDRERLEEDVQVFIESLSVRGLVQQRGCVPGK